MTTKTSFFFGSLHASRPLLLRPTFRGKIFFFLRASTIHAKKQASKQAKVTAKTKRSTTTTTKRKRTTRTNKRRSKGKERSIIEASFCEDHLSQTPDGILINPVIAALFYPKKGGSRKKDNERWLFTYRRRRTVTNSTSRLSAPSSSSFLVKQETKKNKSFILILFATTFGFIPIFFEFCWRKKEKRVWS